MPAKGNDTARKRVGRVAKHPKLAKRETAQRAAMLLRQRQAIEMKAAGASYEQIGRALGVSGKTAFYDVQQAALTIDNETMTIAEQYRAVEVRTMDLVRRQMVPILQGANKEAPADRSRAGMVIVRTSERKSKLLGLDAADRMELTGARGGPVEVSTYEAMPDEELRRRVDMVREALQNAPERPRGDDIPAVAITPLDSPEARYAAVLAARKAIGGGTGGNGNGNNGHGGAK